MWFFDKIDSFEEMSDIELYAERICPHCKFDEEQRANRCFEIYHDTFQSCVFNSINNKSYLEWLKIRGTANQDVKFCNVYICDIVFMIAHKCFDEFWDALYKDNMHINSGVGEVLEQHLPDKKEIWKPDIVIAQCMKD